VNVCVQPQVKKTRCRCRDITPKLLFSGIFHPEPSQSEFCISFPSAGRVLSVRARCDSAAAARVHTLRRHRGPFVISSDAPVKSGLSRSQSCRQRDANDIWISRSTRRRRTARTAVLMDRRSAVAAAHLHTVS